MLVLIVLIFYGFWLFYINKDIKKIKENYAIIDKKVKKLNKEVFCCGACPLVDEDVFEDEKPEEADEVEDAE